MNTLSSNPSKDRIISIDMLRGAVLLLMGFGHITYYLGALSLLKEDVSLTPPYVFFHHWIGLISPTVFIFLAGISVYLYGLKHPSLSKLSQRLITRGFWLIFLELTVINFSWSFGSHHWITLQILWVIGWSMIILAGLIWLPRWLIGVIVVTIITGHNLLDHFKAYNFGDWSWLWAIFHETYKIRINMGFIRGFKVLYPLIPWIGVMAAGYFCAPLYLEPLKRRQFFLKTWGFMLIVGFIFLRFSNFYGDSSLWSVQERGFLYTIMSFLHITRYPPSLLNLMITLGITLVLLSLTERSSGKIVNILVTIGRVPLFFYLIHIPLIHGAAIIWSHLRYGQSGGWWWDRTAASWPLGYKFETLMAYSVWIGFTVLMYFACRWYADLKKHRQNWWFKYL